MTADEQIDVISDLYQTYGTTRQAFIDANNAVLLFGVSSASVNMGLHNISQYEHESETTKAGFMQSGNYTPEGSILFANAYQTMMLRGSELLAANQSIFEKENLLHTTLLNEAAAFQSTPEYVQQKKYDKAGYIAVITVSLIFITVAIYYLRNNIKPTAAA